MPNIGGRPRIYGSNAARQSAYRARIADLGTLVREGEIVIRCCTDKDVVESLGDIFQLFGAGDMTADQFIDAALPLITKARRCESSERTGEL